MVGLLNVSVYKVSLLMCDSRNLNFALKTVKEKTSKYQNDKEIDSQLNR